MQEKFTDYLFGLHAGKIFEQRSIHKAAGTLDAYHLDLKMFLQGANDLGDIPLGQLIGMRILDEDDELSRIALMRFFYRAMVLGEIDFCWIQILGTGGADPLRLQDTKGISKSQHGQNTKDISHPHQPILASLNALVTVRIIA